MRDTCRDLLVQHVEEGDIILRGGVRTNWHVDVDAFVRTYPRMVANVMLDMLSERTMPRGPYIFAGLYPDGEHLATAMATINPSAVTVGIKCTPSSYEQGNWVRGSKHFIGTRPLVLVCGSHLTGEGTYLAQRLLQTNYNFTAVATICFLNRDPHMQGREQDRFGEFISCFELADIGR